MAQSCAPWGTLAWAALTALLVPGAPARAEVMASPLASSSRDVNQVVCYLGNTGPSTITVTNPKILNDTGFVLSLSVNSCGSSLGAGRICVWATDLTQSPTRYVCRVDLSSKANARGSIDLRVRTPRGIRR